MSTQQVDERTKYIVFGCLREIERCLSANIPNEISIMCLSYVGSHFLLHLGEYQWSIDDIKLFNKMLLAKNKQQFKSDRFTIGKLSWVIQVNTASFLYLFVCFSCFCDFQRDCCVCTLFVFIFWLFFLLKYPNSGVSKWNR